MKLFRKKFTFIPVLLLISAIILPSVTAMAADTSYRYRYNETHRYQTSQIGVFQYGDKTLEVHEFKQFEI